MINLNIDKNNVYEKLIISSAVLFSGLIFAQEGTELPVQNNSRWTFGDGIGFGFRSNNYFNLSAVPRVGYMLTNDLEGGVLGSISWQKSNAYSSTMFGIGPFLNYYIARTFFVGANYQHYFINYKDKIYDFDTSANEDALYLGEGYMQRIGDNSFLQLGLMYIVLWKENSSVFQASWFLI